MQPLFDRLYTNAQAFHADLDALAAIGESRRPAHRVIAVVMEATDPDV